MIHLLSLLLPQPLADALSPRPDSISLRGASVHHRAVFHAVALLTHLASDISHESVKVAPHAPISSSPCQTDVLCAGWTYSNPTPHSHPHSCLPCSAELCDLMIHRPNCSRRKGEGEGEKCKEKNILYILSEKKKSFINNMF